MSNPPDGRSSQVLIFSILAAEEYQPELFLLDIALPYLDGYEVARRLRQDPELRKARLVALTGSGREEDRRWSLEVGFDPHLAKSVGASELEEVLASRL